MLQCSRSNELQKSQCSGESPEDCDFLNATKFDRFHIHLFEVSSPPLYAYTVSDVLINILLLHLLRQKPSLTPANNQNDNDAEKHKKEVMNISTQTQLDTLSGIQTFLLCGTLVTMKKSGTNLQLISLIELGYFWRILYTTGLFFFIHCNSSASKSFCNHEEIFPWLLKTHHFIADPHRDSNEKAGLRNNHTSDILSTCLGKNKMTPVTNLSTPLPHETLEYWKLTNHNFAT